MKKPLAAIFAVLAWFSSAFFSCPAADTNALFVRTEDVVYGRKFGTALTMDVFRPVQTNNGIGVIHVVSGGWFSAHKFINADLYRPFLGQGYTVFAVVHGSQPRFNIGEIIQDMHRAVRFIRHHSGRYGVDPERLGVWGGSAGGHLSLMLAVRGGPGASDAKDPVDRESSAVRAAACFFPPTDFLNWGGENENAIKAELLKPFLPAFGPDIESPEKCVAYLRDISPAAHISARTAPSFILHGDADRLVPPHQARIFKKKCDEFQVPCVLEIRKGAGHGWADWTKDVGLFAAWFDEQLRGIPRKSNPAGTK